LSQEALGRVRGFVESQMTSRHTFINKGGQDDLYYTAFGWMLCYALGIMPDLGKTEDYLSSQQASELDMVHYAAYIRCSMIAEVWRKGKTMVWFSSLKPKRIKALQEYKDIPNNDSESPYSQFIWLSLLEDTGNKITEKNQMVESLKDYQAPNGGYRNMRERGEASTNATAAALTVTGQLQGYKKNQDLEYLQQSQQLSGGFPASKASPVPDLLSTATALFTLGNYGQKPQYDAADFLEAHWLDSGGFCPTLIDSSSDVEYTFYGLLGLGTLN